MSDNIDVSVLTDAQTNTFSAKILADVDTEHVDPPPDESPPTTERETPTAEEENSPPTAESPPPEANPPKPKNRKNAK